MNFKKAFFSFLLLVLGINTITSREIHIYPNTSLTIQQAFENAQSGDSIILHKGIYHEVLKFVDKSDITILAAGDGKVEIWGSIKDLENREDAHWKFIKKSGNIQNKKLQYIYQVDIPKKYRLINKSFKDHWIYRNNLYLKNDKMLWTYDNIKQFEARKISNTDGEGVLFERDKITIAINKPIDKFSKRTIFTYTGQVLWLGNLKNVVIDGGEKKWIEFKYSGRYCIRGSGRFENVTIKNLCVVNPIDGFYFNQCAGPGLTIEDCMITKRLPINCTWSERKLSKSMGGSGIVYAGGKCDSFVVKNNTISGFFNGVNSKPKNVIIESNYISNIGDDAVELDGASINAIVRNNIIENCFVAFSLTPIETGPVYIYDNLVFSNVVKYNYSQQKGKPVRLVEPKVLKFWNLPNGKSIKNGESVKLSGNVHFYHNTCISKNNPLAVGNHLKKQRSPVNSTFYNNIFVSSGTLMQSTGFQEDGIDIDNNVFYSSKNGVTEKNLFIIDKGKKSEFNANTSQAWTGNKILPLEYNFKKGEFNWSKNSVERLEKFKLKRLPQHYPDAEMLRTRLTPGAEINNE